MSNQKHIFFKFLALVLLALGLAGCKDEGPTTQAGYLEECKVYSDDQRWAKAIEACAKVDDDEGKHLLAQAYMGRAGIDFFGLMTRLPSASNPTKLILDAAPTTAVKSKDYYRALSVIMDDIQVKTDTMYLEAIILSSLLVYEQLIGVFELKVSGGNTSTCADDSLADCSFTFTTTESAGYTVGLAFGGLGADFYDALCQDPTKTTSIASKTHKVHTVSNYVTDLAEDQDIDYDVTIYSCDIKAKSPLAYNRTAGNKLAGNKLLGDSLDALKITKALDAGDNFSQSVTGLRDAIALCNTGYIDPPSSGDSTINDCEILGYLVQ